MAKFTRIQNSFIAGEISPRFFGRTNLDSYTEGLKTLKNMLVYPQGGAGKRPGTIIQVEDLPENSVIFPFVIDQSRSYIVVCSTGGTDNLPNTAIKLYQNTATGLSEISLTNGTPSTELPGAKQYDGFHAWTTIDELKALSFDQSGELFVIADNTQAPLILAGTTIYNWYNANALFNVTYKPYSGSNSEVGSKVTSADPINARYKSFPYTDFDITAGNVTLSATSGYPVVFTDTSSSINFGASALIDEKTILKATNNGVSGFGQIETKSGFTITTNTLKNYGATTALDSLEVQQWGVGDYPRKVLFNDQRIIFSSNSAYPIRLWGSQQGDIAELMIERPADDAAFGELSNDRPFSFDIAANQLNEINWMISSNRRIFIGSADAEYSVSGPDRSLSFGPLNVNIQKEGNYGSKAVLPINFEGGFVFVERGGFKLREFVFNRDEDAFRANDLNLYADHLSRFSNSVFASGDSTGFERLSYAKNPYKTIWAIDSNGYLFSLVRERLSGVSGWSRHELGGESATDEPAKVLDVTTITNSDGVDDTFVLVKRVINGTTKITLERIAREYEDTTLAQTSTSVYDWPVYVDAAKLLTPENDVTFMANFKTDALGNVFDGSQIAAETGSPTISNGKLVLTSAGQYVEYDATDNADMQQEGCIRILVTPNYTGSPAADRTFIAISKASGDADNLIEIYHDSSGNLGYVIKDSTGTNAATGSAAWSPTSGTEYELLLDFDITGGSNTLYVDGSSHATDSGTGTRDSNIDYMVIGTDEAQNNDPDFSLSYFAIYSADGAGTAVEPRVYGKYIQTQGTIYSGQAVQALSSGQMVCDQTATNGHAEMSSDPGTDKVLFGYKYESELQTLDIEAGSILGSAQGQIKRIEEIVLRFYNTVGAKFGYSTAQQMDEIEFRNYQYGDDEAISLFTGDKVVDFPHGYDRNYYVTVVSDKPYPMYLSCIVMRGLTYD